MMERACELTNLSGKTGNLVVLSVDLLELLAILDALGHLADGITGEVQTRRGSTERFR